MPGTDSPPADYRSLILRCAVITYQSSQTGLFNRLRFQNEFATREHRRFIIALAGVEIGHGAAPREVWAWAWTIAGVIGIARRIVCGTRNARGRRARPRWTRRTGGPRWAIGAWPAG